MSALWGIYGAPYADLSALIDTRCFPTLDRELSLGLSQVESEYTGGTLKWMGVVAPWVMNDGYRDAMDAIRAMNDEDFQDFVALSDDTKSLPLEARNEATFGDETEHPFSLEQQRWLAIRHGVYFPWKVCHHLLANDAWDDKHSGEGKSFTDDAHTWFPETVAFVESLPFVEIGRVVLFGLQPNDHAPLHRDTEPGSSLQIAQSISFAPRTGKRFYLQNSADSEPLVVRAPIYWFNDMDYHGVQADPFFRYSVRVDGVFDPAFVRVLERRARR